MIRQIRHHRSSALCWMFAVISRILYSILHWINPTLLDSVNRNRFRSEAVCVWIIWDDGAQPPSCDCTTSSPWCSSSCRHKPRAPPWPSGPRTPPGTDTGGLKGAEGRMKYAGIGERKERMLWRNNGAIFKRGNEQPFFLNTRSARLGFSPPMNFLFFPMAATQSFTAWYRSCLTSSCRWCLSARERKEKKSEIRKKKKQGRPRRGKKRKEWQKRQKKRKKERPRKQER